MTSYDFGDDMTLPASPDAVWEVLIGARAWPSWAPGFRSVRLRPPHVRLAPEAVAECVVSGELRIKLRFAIQVTGFQPPEHLTVAATGDLVGHGAWTMHPHPDGTHATYRWHVRTTRPLLNLLAALPPAKAVLARNHNRVMSAAAEGLRQRL